MDASVGVKNGIDYCCQSTSMEYKNRVGSFYAPCAVLLDTHFISTQDERNISNGCGEILKLAMVRSSELFELLEDHGPDLILTKFDDCATSRRVIERSIQIMLEELGPNLWEHGLERCVDYGHTFSKIIEMIPGGDLMHGEAVNIDGFFCAVLSHLRGYIDCRTLKRVLRCMQGLKVSAGAFYLFIIIVRNATAMN